MLLGTYEKNGACRGQPRDHPLGFRAEPAARTTSSAFRARAWRSASTTFPVFNTVGIKKVVNGPFTFAPDGNPLIGPVKGLKNYLGRVRRDGWLLPGRRRGARRSPTG